MYVPTFSLTHSIVQNIIAYELAIHDIKTIPTSLKLQRTLNYSLGQSFVQKFGDVFGIRVSEESALNLYLGKDIPTPGSTHLVLSNYRSVMDYIYASAKDPYAVFSPSLLLHLNKLLLNEVLESWECGRFRTISDAPSAQHDPWFTALKHSKIDEDPHRFFLELFQWYADRKHQIHPLFKIAIVLYEILRTYPFLSGNFITTMAVGELLIERSRYSLRGIQVVSRTFLNNNDELLTAVKHSFESEEDATYWIESFVRAIATESTFIRNEAVRLSDRKLRASKDDLAALNPRQLKLIRFFRYHPRITRKQYVSQSGVSTMTAYRDLNDLVKRKIIVQRGGGRSTYYMLRQKSDSLEENLESVTPSREVVKVIKDSDFAPGQTQQTPYASSATESLFD